MQSAIPKRIIQTGKTAQQPLRNRAGAANVRLLNPDFEYLFFDNEAVDTFVAKEFPQYQNVFSGFSVPVQRYDFFRYLAVYHYGGFYFDLDVLLAATLSPLLDAGCVFPFEGLTYSDYLRTRCQIDWEIGNYGFGASARHPFLLAVIENCVKAQKDPEWLKPMMRGMPALSKVESTVLNSTGPGLLTRTLAENPQLASSVRVLFPDDVNDLSSWHHFGAFGVHLMQGSWRPRKNFLRKRVEKYMEIARLQRVLNESRRKGKTRRNVSNALPGVAPVPLNSGNTSEPLVSVLIPAYNAERYIADTIRSAVAQSWPRKEIIVVDDGSKDRTVAIARQFEPHGVKVVEQKNQGAAAARNTAFSLSHGEYIQWLDADDLLAPNKIAAQMRLFGGGVGKRTLLSSPWACFMYRPARAQFVASALWADLSPTEWLLHKMGKNIFMQTGTWLVSRELTEEGGPWDTRLLGDDDGEYFCRLLLASDGVRFVPGAGVYYRAFGFNGLSYIGRFPKKIEAHWLSMQLHIRYIRSLEESPRVHAACLQFLRDSLIYFYPERPDIVQQAEQLAAELGGQLGRPELSWKYAWIEKMFGWELAKPVQRSARKFRWTLAATLDKALHRLESRSDELAIE